MRSIVGMTMALAVCGAAWVAVQQAAATPLVREARYVAMGSSYAAGPGVPEAADEDARCARSTNNYARQFARKRGLDLTDVSCSGATTADVLTGSGDTPAQIDAVTSDTRLVTVTIGGNDVGFVAFLGSSSCRDLGLADELPDGECPEPQVDTGSTWRDLAGSMKRIADEVRVRAPAARLVFVDYLAVLPESDRCAATPMSAANADVARAIARRLASVTAAAALESGATLVRASALSVGHDACSDTPWVHGFPLPDQPRFVPYHPNRTGMAAIADALDRQVR